MLQTRIDVRSETNNAFAITNDEGDVVAIVRAVNGKRQNFAIETQEGYRIDKSNGHQSITK